MKKWMEEMIDMSNSDVMCRGWGGNTKTPSLRVPADVRQWISCMRDRRVLKSVGGHRAAFRLAHASQLSSALQMTLRHAPKSVRMNSASFNTCEAPTSPHKIRESTQPADCTRRRESSQKHQDDECNSEINLAAWS